jgi:hypothetical protein
MNIGSLFQRVGDATSSLWQPRKEEQNTPPVLGGANRYNYGPFKFTTRLGQGVPYEVHASKNLRDWATISQGSGTGEVQEHFDSDAPKHNHRFYRVLAGDLPSINILGYASMTLPPGFSMINNPFDAASNCVSELFKEWPDGTLLSRFDLRLFRLSENRLQNGRWSNPSEELVPGDGAIVFNPTSDYRPLNFVGEVIHGNLTIPVPAGFSVRSSLIPQGGSLDDLEFPIADGDVIHLFDRDQQKYVVYPFDNGKWKSGTPVVSIGESFWVAKTSAKNWTRTLAL